VQLGRSENVKLNPAAQAASSADPTSMALNHRSVIVQTRERNCWKCETAGYHLTTLED